MFDRIFELKKQRRRLPSQRKFQKHSANKQRENQLLQKKLGIEFRW